MINLAAAGIGIALLQKPALLHTDIGEYVEGEWKTLAAPVEIKAVIQAATQKDFVQYGLIDKLDGYVRIYTTAELRVADEDRADAQRIETPQGTTYRIVKAGRRDEAGFTRAIGRLCDDRGRSI